MLPHPRTKIEYTSNDLNMNPIHLIVISAILMFLYVVFRGIQRQQNETVWLRTTYRNAIEEGNKVKALEVGRRYYASTRTGRKLTLYDEQTIANDLAGIVVKRSDDIQVAVPKVTDELTRLRKLYEDNMLTKEEYEIIKQKLLD